jgi:hypothetical protein
VGRRAITSTVARYSTYAIYMLQNIHVYIHAYIYKYIDIDIDIYKYQKSPRNGMKNVQECLKNVKIVLCCEIKPAVLRK